MPRVIQTQAADSIALGDLIERLSVEDFDPRDEDNFASWGDSLKRLANNRDFLAELVVEELKNRCRTQLRDNQYSSQVILLHIGSNFIMRANFWPSMEDSVVRNSGTSPFFYGVAHDHNFSFLTVGYLGPGYWSEYYEYDYDRVIGHPGEKVDLRFIEKSRLEPGKVMLYRAHRDVHNQLAADSMSVSLNIVGSTMTNQFEDQYRFDVASGTIDSTINRISLEPLLALSAHFGGDRGMELLDSFAAAHPSDRIRFLALQARAAAAGGIDERLALYEQAARGSNPYVSASAAVAARRLENGRAWLENQPA